MICGKESIKLYFLFYFLLFSQKQNPIIGNIPTSLSLLSPRITLRHPERHSPYLERSVAESRNPSSTPCLERSRETSPRDFSMRASPLVEIREKLSSRTNVRDLMNIGNIPITLFFFVLITYRYFTYFAILTYPAVLRGDPRGQSKNRMFPMTPLF